MKLEKVKLKNLIFPDYNLRKITPEEIEKLKNSVTEFNKILLKKNKKGGLK